MAHPEVGDCVGDQCISSKLIEMVDSGFGRGAARAEDAQGTPTQSRISPRILVYEDKPCAISTRNGIIELSNDLQGSTRWSSRVSLARNLERNVTKFAPHMALDLIA